MKLREWKYKDILRLSQLEEECFPEEPWSYRMLVSSFESDAFYGVLAEDGDEIIGYGGITVAADTADIANVAVTEAYRHSGVGSALIEKICKIARDKGAEKVFLEVRVSNSAALKLYLKCGFTGVYARTRYYSNGEDCMVIAKKL